MPDLVRVRAEEIAHSLQGEDGELVGFDPFTIMAIISIISTLLPMIIECFEPDDGDQVVQYIGNRYDASKSDNEYRGYDRRLVRATTRRAKQAARKEGEPITWGQATEIAYATLDNLRTSDPAQLTEAIKD